MCTLHIQFIHKQANKTYNNLRLLQFKFLIEDIRDKRRVGCNINTSSDDADDHHSTECSGERGWHLSRLLSDSLMELNVTHTFPTSLTTTIHFNVKQPFQAHKKASCLRQMSPVSLLSGGCLNWTVHQSPDLID